MFDSKQQEGQIRDYRGCLKAEDDNNIGLEETDRDNRHI